jgi:hypothetical protein
MRAPRLSTKKTKIDVIPSGVSKPELQPDKHPKRSPSPLCAQPLEKKRRTQLEIRQRRGENETKGKQPSTDLAKAPPRKAPRKPVSARRPEHPVWGRR